MRVSDIDLSALLRYLPEEGKILLGDQRMMIFSQSSLSTLTEVLVSHLGHELTSSVFAQFGFRSGVDDYAVLSESIDWDSDLDRIASGPALHMWEGIVAVTTEELTFDRATGAFAMRGTWHNSYEAENHRQLFGISETPVCASLTGYASGWASAFLGHRLLAIETSCQAAGDEFCAFAIKPWADWGPEAEPWRRALAATPDSVASMLERRVATRTAELAEANRLLTLATAEAEQARQSAEQARQAAELALHEAESASAAKSRFLARMSHELRTPMNGVMGTGQLLQATDLTAEQATLVEHMLTAEERQVHLVSKVLSFSDLDLGQLTVAAERLDLGEVLEAAVGDAHSHATRQDVSLAAPDLLHQLPAVEADPGRLREVLDELLDNAVKFTPAGGQVKVSVTESDESVTIAIADTGIGIAEEQLTQVFEPFWQGDQSVTRRFGGVGLGCAVAHELVQLMGGTLNVQSTLGEGTIVYVTLPRWMEPSVASASEQADDSAASNLPTAEREGGISGTATADVRSTGPSAPLAPDPRIHRLAAIAGTRIVVAEDDAVSAIVITRMLQAAGAVVSLARDGGEAIRLVAAEDPDVVFLDLHMPVADGLSVARVIRAAEARTGRTPRPVIALTADVFEETRRKCFEAGFNEFLTKPARREQVEATLAAVLATDS